LSTPGPNGFASGRTLPHSLEAEEYLLSSILLDGPDVLPRAREAGIRPDSFYDAKHGIIYRTLCNLADSGRPTEIDVLHEELKSAQQLDAVGGWQFLEQVSGRIPTTAQASYFIERVREQNLLREIIRSATGAVEDCYNFTGGIDEFAAGIERRIASVTGKGTSMQSRLEAARLNPDVEPAPLSIRFTVAEIPIATPGNLVAVCAQAKAGKSAFIGACIGATFTASRNADFLGVLGHNAGDFAVVHVDTEQAPSDHWGIIQTAKRRAGIERTPAWLHSYATAGWSAKERRAALPQMLRIAKNKHGGIHAVFLDGVADFINDPNAGDEVFPFVDEIRGLSVEFDCPIFVVLHLNPGTEKGRGHLGSQLERRAETNLVLDKDAESGRTVVFSTKQRRAPILKADGPAFRWDDGNQMHVSVESVRAERDEAERDALHELAADCYADLAVPRMRYNPLVLAIEKTAKCKERTAQEKVKRMKKLGVIREVPPRLLEFVS